MRQFPGIWENEWSDLSKTDVAMAEVSTLTVPYCTAVLSVVMVNTTVMYSYEAEAWILTLFHALMCHSNYSSQNRFLKIPCFFASLGCDYVWVRAFIVEVFLFAIIRINWLKKWKKIYLQISLMHFRVSSPTPE